MSSWFPYGGVGPYGTYGNLGLYGALVAYGNLNLTESSPPQSFTEPLTLAEVKSYLKVPERSPTDTAEDDELMSLISAARESAEILQGRDLVRKQWDLSDDYWPSYRIALRAPLVSVDLAQYRDSNGNYTVLTQDIDFIVDASKGPGSAVQQDLADVHSLAVLIAAVSVYERLCRELALLVRRRRARKERHEASDQCLVQQPATVRGAGAGVSVRGDSLLVLWLSIEGRITRPMAWPAVDPGRMVSPGHDSAADYFLGRFRLDGRLDSDRVHLGRH